MKYYIFTDYSLSVKVSKTEFFSFIKRFENKIGSFIEEEPALFGFDYVVYFEGIRKTIGFSLKS